MLGTSTELSCVLYNNAVRNRPGAGRSSNNTEPRTLAKGEDGRWWRQANLHSRVECLACYAKKEDLDQSSLAFVNTYSIYALEYQSIYARPEYTVWQSCASLST